MKCHLFLTILLALQGVRSQPDEIRVRHSIDIKSGLEGDDLCLALSSDGHSLFTASGTASAIYEYDTMTRHLRRRIPTPLTYIRCLQVSADGRMLAAGGDGLVLFDLNTTKMAFHHKPSAVNCVTFARSNKALALGTADDKVEVVTL